MFVHEFVNDYQQDFALVVTVEQHWKTSKIWAPNTDVYEIKAVSEDDLCNYCLIFTGCKNEKSNI